MTSTTARSTPTDTEDNYDQLAYQQRLKAAIHYTVSQILREEAAEKDVRFNKQFTAVVAESTSKYAERMAIDLELFAKHAKRSTIQVDDVRLLVRKSGPLLQHIDVVVEDLNTAQQDKRAKKGAPRTKKRKTTSARSREERSEEAEDEDSNM